MNSLKTMNEINKFPVKDLPSRYNVGRTALYARFTAALITPEKDGTRSYISGEELEELDRLDSHLKTGGKLEDFQPANNQSLVVSQESAVNGTPTADNFNETLQLVEAIARHFQQQRDPLQHYAALERAIASGWLLSTSEVRSLIGTKPHGDRFQHGSFVFVKSGKIRNQAAWKVLKVVEGSGSYKV
ncbi:hypothetical protein QUB56_31860 [Microcoleus sp. AR_TQ3_B6]